jgi:two-component system sensor histidine kinase UhpB
LESWLTFPDKPPRYFVSSGKPMFDADGQFIGYRGVTKEVTERMRNIEDLRRFRAAMDATADAIFLVDHGTLTFVDANVAACHLVGYTREELLRLSAADLAASSSDQLKALSEGLVGGKDRGVETVRMRHKDGSKLSVEMQRRALRSGQDWVIVVVARDLTERKRTEAALQQSQEDLRRLAAHQEHIKEEERKRIAREIHDELGGVLTGIKANISVSIDRAVSTGLPPDPLLVDSARLADAAIETVRRVISDLRPSVLDQLGVWTALDWYASQIQARTGLQCRCIVSNSAANIELDSERSTMLFRVVQEALTNVVRHAAASHVAISVWCEENAILVEIRDDGKGIDPQKLFNGESWGILGMHERTRHFGGDIKFNGTPGKGTAVLLQLPLEEANVK